MQILLDKIILFQYNGNISKIMEYNMNPLYKLLFSTSRQKVLAFLAENAGEEYQEKEIAKKTGVKKSSVNLALRDLFENKIINRKKIGRTSLYSADIRSNIIREIKIIQNITLLEALIAKLARNSQKIILFGSFSDGTNKQDSDIDLFILTADPAASRRILNDSALAERIQAIVKTPAEMLKINKKKPLLFQEIEKGKVLWEINEN